MESIAAAAHRQPQQPLAARFVRPRRTLRAALALSALLLPAVVTAAPAAASAQGQAGGVGGTDQGSDHGAKAFAPGSDLPQRLKQSPLPVLVEFWAPWCGPCRRLEQPLADLARETKGRVRIVRVNIDSSPRSAERYGVELLPTIVLFDRGVELDRLTGVPATSELRSRIGNVLRPPRRTARSSPRRGAEHGRPSSSEA